LSNVCF